MMLLALLFSFINTPGVGKASVTSPEFEVYWSYDQDTQSIIEPGLRAALNAAQAGDMISVIVTLRDQIDTSKLGGPNRRERLEALVTALQAKARGTQKPLVKLLDTWGTQGLVAEYTSFWVFNGLAVRATPGVINALANHPLVIRVTPDEAAFRPTVDYSSPAEANISLVNAPALWALGHRGQGIVIATMDTGAYLNHPDLVNQWRGGSNSWFDPYGEHPDTPTDLNGHGTQTLGVILGGDAGGTIIGVAPEAQWIAVKIFDDADQATTSGIHAGFQWLLDPDGNPATADAPHVVNNSWTYQSPGCNLEFELDLQALRAAGILPVFAAGNGGPDEATSYSPANNPSAFAVGATTLGDTVLGISSRGPEYCSATAAIYPELVAPGDGIHTADLYGTYTDASGTSMAAPHVAGGLALLLSSFPDLNPDEQYEALVNSAVDLAPAGPDNSTGYGRLDLEEAYNWLNGPIVVPSPTDPGDLDVTFGSNGLTFTDIGTASGDKAFAVMVQPDQKIVVAGSSDNGADNDFAVARYTSLGILDTSFSDDGIQTTPIGSGDDVAYAVGIQSDGKLVVAGSAFNGVNNDFALARYTITGTLDTTFGVNGVVTTTLSTGDDVARGLVVQADDKIVVAGSANGDFGIVRYSSEGGLDTATFGGGDGIVITDFFGATDVANGIAIQPGDGKLVAAGYSDIGPSEEFALARYLTNGSLDSSFAGTGKVTTDFVSNSVDQAYSVDIQADGKIVLAGFINSGGMGGNDDFALARYNSIGSLDTTFGTGGKVVTPVGENDDQAYSVAIQPTGKIVVAGFSDSGVPTNQDFSLARYTITGTLDTTFGATGVISTDLGTIDMELGNESADQAYAVAIQADNKIVVAGYTDHPSGNDNFAVVRYESPNALPTLAKVYKTGLEESDIFFTTTDFTSAFSDSDGDILRKIEITSLPDFGTLNLNGSAVAQGQVILPSEAENLTFTPQEHFYGITSFKWNGFDGLDYAGRYEWVEFFITPVNDAPSFIKGADQTVLEDAGRQYVVAWATELSPGGLFENSQTLTFTLTTSNEALFSVLPKIDPSTGSLSYTPAVDINGSADITVVLEDSGGTADGGSDTSIAQFFSISAMAVNDAPSFTKGADQTVLEDAGPQSVGGWASDISSGPTDESGQTTEFILTTSNDALFASLPEIDSTSGDLSYTPADDAYGSATVTTILKDNGGTDNNGKDTSAEQLFIINILPVNDGPTISDIPDQTVFANHPAGPLTFTIGDIDTASKDLIVSGSSSNQTLVPDGEILFEVSGATRTVTLTPSLNSTGTTTITISVADGFLTSTDIFKLTVETPELYMPLVLKAGS
jgi:uncharacterized delta-60 repeat protein